MKIKRNNKSMTIDVSNGKLQKKFATGGHLYEFGTEDFSLKPTSSNINLSEGTQPTTTTTPNGLHYSNAIDLSVATKGNNSTTPNGLPNGAGSMDLGKGKGTTPSTPSKKISTSDAVSGVSGIIQAGVEGYGKNSQIADTSTQRTEANDLKNKVLQDNSFQSLNNDISNTSLMNNLSFSDVRGLSGGQMGMNVLHSTLDGASSGASMGPIGAAAGAMVGLAGSAIGISVGNSKAFREQKRINNLINNANSSFLNNTSNQVYNIQNQTMANQGRNYFAQGGHLFEDGGKNDKYIDSNSKNAKHVVLQTDYTKPVINNYGRVFYPFSSGVVVDDKSSGLKPEIGKSGFVEHDVNQTLSGIQFDKNGNVVKNTYKESPSVNDDTRIPITSSPSVLPNGERREEPYEPTDEQQYYRHGINGDDVDFQDRSMAAGLALAGIPFGGWYAAALNVPQALYTWKHRDETNGVNKFLDYASVIPGMKFTKALNLSTNPAIIRSARLAAMVTKKAHPSDIAIRSKQFAAPVAALQMVHKAGDAQNVLTYPSLVKDWFNRQLIDTRFDNYLDSPVKPLILNKFADGGDIDEKKAVETPGQWERRYVNSPEFEKRYKSILYHGADVPSLQDIRDQVNNTHYLHVNFDNGMGSRQMVPLNVRTNVADTYDYGLRHKNEFELSHYVKPVGKGNPWIVEDTRPYPATADFTKDNVMPHEHGHVIDFNNYLSTAEYNDDGSTQPDPKYMFDANRKPIDKANSSISYSHDSKEAENYADINALKYNLYKFGIKDIANGDIVTIDDIRKFKDIINKMPVKQRNAYNRIFYLFDDDAIVRFLNKLADSNNHPDVNVPSVNVFAEGGHLFKNGNNVHVGVPSMLTARNESKPYLPTITRQTIKTGKVYNYYDNDHNKKPVKKVHTKSLVGDQVFIPLSPYQWTKDYVNSDVFKNRLASIFNYRNDANGELYNEVKHNIDNVGIFNVDMKKPDSYFINRLPSNASVAIYNHRRYDGYGNDAASFYDPVENIVINDVSKQ